jgi:hypothetical protein
MSPATENAVTIFIDYGCPYVYRAAEWINTLTQQAASKDFPAPQVTWRYFSLAQVNYKAKDGWQVWNAPRQDPNWGEQTYARGLRFFWASAAAKAQGQETWERFHLALLNAIHAERREFTSFEPILEVAQGVGLDMDRMVEDIANQELLHQLAEDHTAASEYNVFGVPTFLFAGAEPAYLKLSRLLEPDEAVDFWETYQNLVAQRPYVIEIKRPQ